MYFSNFNEDVTYSNHGDGTLEVCSKGTGIVCKEDTDVFPRHGSIKQWATEYFTISLTEGVNEVGPGFLEQFTRMRTLIIHYSVRSIELTPGLKTMLRKNKVLIRGWYDSLGERLAEELGLKFLHADIMVGWANEEVHFTNTKLEIRFTPKGKPYRAYDDYCPGSSAGSYGGGSYEDELEDDFYAGQTLKSFAERLPRFSNAILENKDLEYYLRTANERAALRTSHLP